MRIKRKYEIWSEGYAATGQRSKAMFHTTIEASSFNEACDLLAVRNQEFRKFYDPHTLTYWGCKLFDNEIDARKLFG